MLEENISLPPRCVCDRSLPLFVKIFVLCFWAEEPFRLDSRWDRWLASPSCLVASWRKLPAGHRFDTNLHWAARDASILRTTALNKRWLISSPRWFLNPVSLFCLVFTVSCYFPVSLISFPASMKVSDDSHNQSTAACPGRTKINFRCGFCKDAGSESN